MKQANLIGVDYVLLSPVKTTKSHPQQEAMGWDKFEQLCRLINVPVYALGGMVPEDLEQARLHGAKGIAMLSAIWNSEFPENLFNPVINV